jgi:hypothetical protein
MGIQFRMYTFRRDRQSLFQEIISSQKFRIIVVGMSTPSMLFTMMLIVLLCFFATVLASQSPGSPSSQLERRTQNEDLPGLLDYLQTVGNGMTAENKASLFDLVQSFQSLIAELVDVLDKDISLGPVSDLPSIVPSDIPSTVPSDFPSTVSSDFPSMAPSDLPSQTPSDVPSPSDAPYSVPSDIPSLLPLGFIETPDTSTRDVVDTSSSGVPSDVPSGVPSDMPSNMPSDMPSTMPSDAPSDVPSLVPSDVPSLVPSDLPSVVPSDSPSVVPSAWHATEYNLPAGYDVCGFSESIEFSSLNEIQVVYLYKLELSEGTSLVDTTSNIEAVLQQAVLDGTCKDASNRHRNLARAHAVSPEPPDIPSGTFYPKRFSSVFF